MKNNKQNADFLHLGIQLINWYEQNERDLPFRKTKNPYKIWICEIVFQQTRIQQGLEHYTKFIERFPTVESLAEVDVDQVMLYWKGLGYYSRAINLHKAANQIMNDFGGVFPSNYDDIIKLKGVGKYTASAIASICFNEQRPAVDGNFYRVLSRVFADDFDISSSKAFDYFSELAFDMIPKGIAGTFNQAMMDLGSEICKPKRPICSQCPFYKSCLAFQTGAIASFPYKKKKTKVNQQSIDYYYLYYEDYFLIQQRGTDSIWKRLYEFPMEISKKMKKMVHEELKVNHLLSHIKMEITFYSVSFSSLKEMTEYADSNALEILDYTSFNQKSFPKPIENFISNKING